MNWNTLPYYGQDGSIAEVFVNDDKTQIKKIYRKGGTTVSGKQCLYSEEAIEQCFKTELRWNEMLQSKWIPQLIHVDEENKTLIQEYYGLDLLPYYQNDTLHTTIPNLVDQVIEMFEFFAKHKVYKINNSLSNLTVKDGQLIAFDFKWAQDRPNWKFIELYGYKEWMSKIDNKLPEILEKLA